MKKYLFLGLLAGFAVRVGAQPQSSHIETIHTQFNGYTNYWHDTYKEWDRYGSLFKLARPDLLKTIAQSKLDVAEDIGLPGLDMQEGFLDFLLSSDFEVIPASEQSEIQQASPRATAVFVLKPGSEAARTYGKPTTWRQALGAHQLGAVDFSNLHAWLGRVGNKQVAFILADAEDDAKELVSLIQSGKQILKKYNLYKGWMGAETLLKSVTCVQGHPLEIIGRGLNEGNRFFTFNGYMDFLMQPELDTWIRKSGLPVVADVGFSPIFGCRDYTGLQVQDMKSRKDWIDFAHSHGGYVFRPVYDPEADSLHLPYDGYLASEGNKEQIDEEDKGFITLAGSMDDDLIHAMVLFVPRKESFDREAMWSAILEKRSVAILDQAHMMGSDPYRKTLGLLYLDRSWLEDYFGDAVGLEAVVDKYNLKVSVTNFDSRSISGSWQLLLPEELKPAGLSTGPLTLAAGETKELNLPLRPTAAAMGRTNPVSIRFKWAGHEKLTMAILDLPPAISVHRLLFGQEPEVHYPVTIHNFSTQKSFPVSLEVFPEGNSASAVYKTMQTCTVDPANFRKMEFRLPLKSGHYRVRVSCLGVDYISQLGVEGPSGRVSLREEDLNGDGVPEYILENDSVRVTLLTTGARVIEYYVKSRKDNVLFKLWPEKADADRRPYRKRGYYPYGGFEDFLGQGSMETHKRYTATVLKKEGDYVRVHMQADYFGNKLEKTFTLYGNTPLLEIRFALTFKNPEANVLGPQPILQLGDAHGPEDLFTAPSENGIVHYRMRMDEYYGQVIHLKEGWNAGYDEKQDIAYAGAYPVDQPLFLHMWMNHPRNPDAHYYYTEFQPWTPIIQKTTMYFSYYMWGEGGSWESAVQALRNRNLITIKK